MPTYSQIPIRCRLSIVSNPPAYPIDDNTGEAPRFWRGQDVVFQVGIFNSMNVAVDLSNIAELQLTIREQPTSPFALASTISGTIIPTISYSSWANGTAQQASFNLTAALTDLPLDGLESRPLWLDIKGYTSTGQQLVYGAGYITVYNPGAYVPPAPPGVVEQLTYTNATGNTLIQQTNQIATTFVTVTGSARTSVFILQRDNLLVGATNKILFTLPATSGIVLQVRDDLVSGPLLATFTTDGVQPNALMEFTYGSGWNITNAIIPAF